jgi:hypothetical protein
MCREKTEVKVLNPIFVNPCSYQAVVEVLDTVVRCNNKRWVVIGCDGLPFKLCSKIIENYFESPHCYELFTKKSNFHTHANTFNVNGDLDIHRKYKNV